MTVARTLQRPVMAVAACLGLLTTSCSAEAPLPPTSETSSVTQSSSESRSQAPIAKKILQLVFVETKGGMSSIPGEEGRDIRSQASKYIHDDPDVKLELARNISAATFGRLKIMGVNVDVARKKTPLVSKGCFDSIYSGPDSDAVDAATKSFGGRNEILAAVVMAGSCSDDDDTYIAGYEIDGETPAVMARGIDDRGKFAETILEEYGHSKGLSHAGVAVCDNPERATGCTTDQTGDEGIMSYNDTKPYFSAPELAKLGLLRDSEIVELPISTQKISIYDVADSSSKPKVMKFPTMFNGKKTTGYISYEGGSLQLRYDKPASDGQVLDGQDPDRSLVRVDHAFEIGDTITMGNDGAVTVLSIGGTLSLLVSE